ncbi:bifunctional diguanylate cyclase/phosphodiesterase [Vibrio sinensis]|nr:GGDEF domain-containing phosphodiesterase [Vibrio sinensis]
MMEYQKKKNKLRPPRRRAMDLTLDDLNNQRHVTLTTEFDSDTLAKESSSIQHLDFSKNAINEWVWDWNLQNGAIKHNKKWLEIIDDKDHRLIHTIETYLNIIHPDDRNTVISAIERCIADEGPFHCQYRMKTRGNQFILVRDSGDVVERDSDGKPLRVVGAILNITEQIEQERTLRMLAFQDSLTGVFNRGYFYEQVQQRLEQSESNLYCAIISADVDNFKLINDRFGHQSGDNLLCFVGQQLLTLTQRAEDIVARFGADEFVVALFFDRDKQSEHLTSTIAMSETIVANIQDYGLNTHASPDFHLRLGLYHGKIEDSLEFRLHLADIALSHAKRLNAPNCVCYQEWMGERFAIRRELMRCLEQDLSEHFIAYIQPIVDQKQNIVGGEILLRWRNQAGELVPPIKFIDELETMRKLPMVTYWLFQRVISMINQYQWHHLSFSINISPSHFSNTTFMAQLMSLLAQYPEVKNLKMEITETVMFEDVAAIRASMDDLIDHKIQFSLDDFGTGFSSIDHLLQLPITELKIDKSFVGNIEHEQNRSVIELILAMAHNMKLSCVAEGIEQAEQLDYIRALGCEKFQGYYFSRPVPEDEFVALINNQLLS